MKTTAVFARNKTNLPTVFLIALTAAAVLGATACLGNDPTPARRSTAAASGSIPHQDCIPSNPLPIHEDLTASPLYKAATCLLLQPELYQSLDPDSMPGSHLLNATPEPRALLITIYLRTELTPQQAEQFTPEIADICRQPHPSM